MLKEVKELCNDVENVLKLQEDSKLPPGLKLLMGDTFKCCICHGMITPPVAYTRCCRSIAGCEICFDTFFGGEEGRSKCCPLCRKERAANEMSRVNGMGEFLTRIRVFFNDAGDDKEEDEYMFHLPA